MTRPFIQKLLVAALPATRNIPAWYVNVAQAYQIIVVKGQGQPVITSINFHTWIVRFRGK